MSCHRFALLATAFVFVAGFMPSPPSIACVAEAPVKNQTLRHVLPNAAELADEIERAWVRHDLRWWFPRVIDEEGGFHEGFNDDGTPVERGDRHSIFQSRMTWVAATIARRRPEHRDEFEPVIRHGLAYLRDHFIADDGGVWWGIDAAGQPLANGERHLYNTAFAIYAAAAAERALPGAGGLELGKEIFDFLEKHAHNAEHGGYFEHYARDGHAITSADDPSASANGFGPMMPHYGDLSMNAQIHLLEALSELYHIWPDERLERRLRESYDIVATKLYGEPGFLHLYLNADFTPLPDHTSFGHNIETAFLLVEAAEALGVEEDAEVWRKAAALTDTALRVGWDEEHGGLNDVGNVYEVQERRKDWWVQAESLNALLMMADYAARHGDVGDYTAQAYADHFVRQWRFIQTHLLDEENGGWYWGVNEDLERAPQPKAGPWKTSYHTSRALLNVVDRLRSAGD